MTSGNITWLTDIEVYHYCPKCKRSETENIRNFIGDIYEILDSGELHKSCTGCNPYEPMVLERVSFSPAERVLLWD